MAAFKQSGLQYGSYYSNQPAGGAGSKSKLLVVAVILLVLGGLGFGIMTLLSNNAKADISLLAVKENSLLAVTTEAQENLTGDAARVANSNATILLTSDVTSLITVTDIKKLPDGQVKQYVDTNGETLKQAKLLDKFDETYRRIVIEKVSDLILEAQTVETKTSNQKWRAEVTQALANLQSIKKQFEAL